MERDRTPDWMLERLLAGDLPEAEARSLRERIGMEEGGAERMGALEASNRAILAAHPPARIAASIRQRADGGATRSWGRLSLVAAAPALALVVFLALPGTSPEIPAEGGEGIRLKGAEPTLLVHRQQAPEPERLQEGSPARAGDLLQLSYRAAGRAFGVVLSIDGRGVVTRHLPAAGETAAPLAPDGAVPLPQAYELDDAPAYERFFFVSSHESFAVETALEAARLLVERGDAAGGELPLPAALFQTSFLLEKVQ